MHRSPTPVCSCCAIRLVNDQNREVMGFFLSPSPSFRFVSEPELSQPASQSSGATWAFSCVSKNLPFCLDDPILAIQGHLPPRRTNGISHSISFTAIDTAGDGRHGRDRARAHRGKEQFFLASFSEFLSFLITEYLHSTICRFVISWNGHVLWCYRGFPHWAERSWALSEFVVDIAGFCEIDRQSSLSINR